MYRVLTIIAISLLTASAQEKVSLAQIDALVKKNMSELKAADLRVNQARTQKGILLSEFDFQVRATAAADRLLASNNLSTFRFPRGEKEQYSTALNVSKNLFSFGRNTANEKLGFAQILESQIQKKALYRDLLFRARLKYWEVLFQNRSKSLAIDFEDLRAKEASDAEALFEAGVSSKVDVLQSKVNRLSAQDTVESSELSLKQSQRDFSSSIGEVEKRFDLEGELSLPTDLDRLFRTTNEMITESLEVDSLAANNKASKAKIEELEGRQRPELSASGSAGWAASEAQDLEDSYQAGLTVSWAIFSGKLYKRQQLLEKDNILANELSMMTEIRERKRKLFRLKDESEILKIRLKNEEKSMKLSKENYEIAREQYRAGLLTLTQLSDVNFQWIESQFNYVSLVYQSQVLRENLLYLNFKK